MGRVFFILLSFGCTRSLLLCEGFLWLQQVEAAILWCSGFLTVVASLVGEHRLWGTWALVAVVHRLVAPQHVGSSPTRDQTHVSYIGRWTVIHWTTREVLFNLFKLCIHGVCAVPSAVSDSLQHHGL